MSSIKAGKRRRKIRLTRRELIQSVAAAAPIVSLLPRSALADDPAVLVSPDDAVPAKGLLRITLRPPAGRDVPAEARVGVRVDGNWLEATRSGSARIFERMVPTGNAYQIEIRAPGYRTIDRVVPMNSSLRVERVYLLPTDWPFYRIGGIEVPFEPRPRFAAVAVDRRLNDQQTHDLLQRAANAGFRAITRDPSNGEQLDDVNSSVLYFVPIDPSVSFFSFEAVPGQAHHNVSPDAVTQLRAIFSGYGGRVGSPAQTESGSVRIIDNKYVIRFANNTSDEDAQRFGEEIRGSIVRQAEQAAGFWLLEFDDPQNIGRHLGVLDSEVRSGRLTSAEPNLLFQVNPHAINHAPGSIASLLRMFLCQATELSDPYVACQSALTRQRIKEAWCFIEATNPDRSYGSPGVMVASIDDGITYDSSNRVSSQRDVAVERLTYCYDVETNSKCVDDPALDDDKKHGMATYGVISAKEGNAFGTVGVAPGASHIVVRFTGIISDTVTYADTLAWVGGIRETPPKVGVPPIGAAADIINCSHGLESTPVPTYVQASLKQLTCRGRGGRGTVLVYSGGNNNCYMEDELALATSPYTIGVANTDVQAGKEQRWVGSPQGLRRARGSNYSPYLNLCANGQDAPSLRPRVLTSEPNSCNDVPGSGNGVMLHGETSAAAAMVSGAAALVLTVNPELNWLQVRQVLCASAEKIDCSNVSDLTDCDGNPQTGRWRTGKAVSPPNQPPTCDSIPRGMTWMSDFYGFGRIDVLAAVTLASQIEAEQLPSCDAAGG